MGVTTIHGTVTEICRIRAFGPTSNTVPYISGTNILNRYDGGGRQVSCKIIM
jgi:hypothetical protein